MPRIIAKSYIEFWRKSSDIIRMRLLYGYAFRIINTLWGESSGHQLIPSLKGQLPLKTMETLTKVLCIIGSNLVILAWTGPELSRGQAIDWHTNWHTRTHPHTDAGNDNTRWPKLASGKNPNISGMDN